jgi:hypothetical protein
MGEHLVEQVELRACAGDGAAQARKVVQLTKGAGEGRLAALVGAGDDDDPFRAAQAKVIANRGGVIARELAR